MKRFYYPPWHNGRVFSWAGLALAAVGVVAMQARAETLKVAVVQTVIESTLEKNRAKLVGFVEQAKAKGCDLVIFPECALYWSDIATDKPAKADLDAAIGQLGQAADRNDVYVLFGTSYKLSDTGQYHNRGVAYDPGGNQILFYWKDREVPRAFNVGGVLCNLVICSDRGYLEHSDLPCLVQGSQIIIDISGGHGGDDGRPDLRWIRYRPWAERTGAYVIVANPLHEDTDFMGNSPWGGGSAIIRPDGSIQASRTHEKDVMIVEELDLAQATRQAAQERRNHPLFKPFWDTGQRLLEGAKPDAFPQVTPYSSAQRDIKIAVAQMSCSRDIRDNTQRMVDYIRRAAAEGADVVVFPELAVTGARSEDILVADEAALTDALKLISSEAKLRRVYVIVGTPWFDNGVRQNCAVVIGDDGTIKTRYAQITPKSGQLFTPGTEIGRLWFTLKGVYSIVTIGEDARWVEIGDLAANRGMYLHFHLSYEADASPDSSILRRQRNLLALMYAQYGAVVNAADPSALPNPSAPASGGSLIVSREGGHNQPAPKGIEYYLPYQTSIVTSAGATETMISATRRTQARNNYDLDRYWRNRNRKARVQSGWHEWMEYGAWLVGGGSQT